MKFIGYKPNDVFRNTIECNHCGILYAIEFTFRRFTSNKQMITECPNGHIQTTILRPVYENGGLMRLIDHVENERGVC